MPIMHCTRDRCLWVATAALPQPERAAHLRCSRDADLQTSPGVGEPRSSLSDCSETAPRLICDRVLTTAVRDRLLGRQLWKGLGVAR